MSGWGTKGDRHSPLMPPLCKAAHFKAEQVSPASPSAFRSLTDPSPSITRLSSSLETLLLFLSPNEDWFPCSLQVFPSPTLPLHFSKTRPSLQHPSRAPGSIYPHSQALFSYAPIHDYPRYRAGPRADPNRHPPGALVPPSPPGVSWGASSGRGALKSGF